MPSTQRANREATLENEQTLVAAARAGDEAAFEALLRHHTPALYRVVRRMTADEMETEAILQETFFRFWQALPRYQDDRPLFPYLVTIAANLARDRWRRSRRLSDAALDEIPEVDDKAADLPEAWLLRQETLAALAAAVEELPPPYRAVIALRYDAEMRYEDIAAALDLPLNTVRTHLRRAKAHLRAAIEEKLK